MAWSLTSPATPSDVGGDSFATGRGATPRHAPPLAAMPTDQPWWSAYAADRAIRDMRGRTATRRRPRR